MTKINQVELLKNFRPKEWPTVSKLLSMLQNAEYQNKGEEELLKQSMSIVSRFMLAIWELFRDASIVLGFFTIYCLPLLFVALKYCGNINYNKRQDAIEKNKNKNKHR